MEQAHVLCWGRPLAASSFGAPLFAVQAASELECLRGRLRNILEVALEKGNLEQARAAVPHRVICSTSARLRN